jgi:hypothetical protein
VNEEGAAQRLDVCRRHPDEQTDRVFNDGSALRLMVKRG